MKHLTKYLSALFVCFTALQADNNSNNNCGVSPTFVARSQARYKIREDVGVAGLTNLYNQDNSYGVFSVIPGYMQSFRAGHIAHTLFGSSLVTTSSLANVNCGNCANECGATILIQGSQYNGGNRTAGAWLADNFYLSPNYNGAFTVKPKIKDFFVDFDFYAGLDEFWCGAYFRIYAPYVHSKWELNFCETPNTNATSSVKYPFGYFDCIENAPETLLTSFAQYAAGTAPTFATGSCVNPTGLKFAKITNCQRTKNGLGDLRAELGWNMWQTECTHVGINIQAAAPTGTRRRAEFLFDAVVGNGKHWELGGGLTGHYMFWNNESETEHFGFYFDANLTHLFKAREERTFDLKGKPNSRYMLAAHMGLNKQNLTGDTPFTVAASNQFDGDYAPVANLTTLDIRVSTGIQADVVAWFNYTRCGWSLDLGYNFFGRSKEHFDCRDLDCNNACGATSICDTRQADSWVLKGDERVFGFPGGTGVTGAPVALSASESRATICKGTNKTTASCVTIRDQDDIDFYNNNCGVDNRQTALVSGLPLVLEPGLDIIPANSVQTSIQPIFIDCCDLDFAGTRNITNTVFAHLSYAWERECWTPFFGIGGFGEFGKNCGGCNSCSTNDGCTSVTNSCNIDTDDNCSGSKVDTSLSRWGVWIKGGVAF